MTFNPERRTVLVDPDNQNIEAANPLPVTITASSLPTGAATSAHQISQTANQTTSLANEATGLLYQAVARTAFGWVRTADPLTLFDSSFQYDIQPLLWETIVAGGGVETHLPNEASVQLSTGNGTSASLCRKQTREWLRYQPGKGALCLFSFVLGARKAGVRKRAGYFSEDGGLFIEQTATDLRIVRRSKTSGSVVDTVVASADWNGYKPPINESNTLLAFIAFEWLGVGRAIVGFVDPVSNELKAAHTFGTNNLTTVWVQTPNLPITYEIENTGAADGATTLKAICSALISEGGFEDTRGFLFSAANGITAVPVTTRRPVLSIRPAATFNSLTNRGQITLKSLDISAASNSSYWEIIIGGALTGASFGAVNASSAVEVDVAATAISGGIRITGGYAISGAAQVRGITQEELLNKLPIVLNAAATTATNVSLVCTSFSGTSNVTASIGWKELR